MQRLDSQFPTWAEATLLEQKDGAEPYSKIYAEGEVGAETPPLFSDHLPLLFKVEVQAKKKINLLSLNVMGNMAYSNNNYITDESLAVRYERIAEFLLQAIKKNDLDVILLQEVADKSLVKFLKEKTLNNRGGMWIVEVGGEKCDVVTCVNPARFSLEDLSNNPSRRILTLKLVDRKNHNVVNISNIWGVYNYYPENIEKDFKTCLLSKKAGEVSIIAGDTNSRSASLGKSKNNVIALVPVPYNKKFTNITDAQVGDFSDGCYVSNKGDSIDYVPYQVLNFQTGDVILEEDRKLPENYEFSDLRPMLCIDDKVTLKTKIMNKNLSEIAETFASHTGLPLSVRFTVNCHNEFGFVLYGQAVDKILEWLKNFRTKGVDGFESTKMMVFKDYLQEEMPFVKINAVPDDDTGENRLIMMFPFDYMNIANENVKEQDYMHKLLDAVETKLAARKFLLDSLSTRMKRDFEEKIIDIYQNLYVRVINAPLSTSKIGYKAIIDGWKQISCDGIKTNEVVLQLKSKPFQFWKDDTHQTYIRLLNSTLDPQSPNAEVTQSSAQGVRRFGF